MNTHLQATRRIDRLNDIRGRLRGRLAKASDAGNRERVNELMAKLQCISDLIWLEKKSRIEGSAR
jgi:hypothetical protein